MKRRVSGCNTDIDKCSETIYNCIQMIGNLAILLEPFLPFSSAKIKGWLGAENGWSVKSVPAGFIIPKPDILFERLDKKAAEEELVRMVK